MRLIDLSQPLFDDCPNCPVHPPVRSKVIADHPQDGWRLEHLSIASHTGSHVDAPLHKLAHGQAIDAYPLESFVGMAHLADLRHLAPGTPIGPAHLAQSLPPDLADKIVLLATGYGQRRAKTDDWHHHSPRLDPAGATWLAERRIRGVAIDHFSIGGTAEPANATTHTILLEKNIWIAEELYFPNEVFQLPQPLEFWALPINLKGHSGSFCRPVVVIRE